MSTFGDVNLLSTCPYCGFSNKHLIEVQSYYFHFTVIVACDSEEGGCDKEYAVRIQFKLDTTVYPLGAPIKKG